MHLVYIYIPDEKTYSCERSRPGTGCAMHMLLQVYAAATYTRQLHKIQVINHSYFLPIYMLYFEMPCIREVPCSIDPEQAIDTGLLINACVLHLSNSQESTNCEQGRSDSGCAMHSLCQVHAARKYAHGNIVSLYCTSCALEKETIV